MSYQLSVQQIWPSKVYELARRTKALSNGPGPSRWASGLNNGLMICQDSVSARQPHPDHVKSHAVFCAWLVRRQKNNQCNELLLIIIGSTHTFGEWNTFAGEQDSRFTENDQNVLCTFGVANWANNTTLLKVNLTYNQGFFNTNKTIKYAGYTLLIKSLCCIILFSSLFPFNRKLYL